MADKDEGAAPKKAAPPKAEPASKPAPKPKPKQEPVARAGGYVNHGDGWELEENED